MHESILAPTALHKFCEKSRIDRDFSQNLTSAVPESQHLSCVDNIEQALARIRRDETNSFTVVLEDAALARAAALDAAGTPGPLHGMPVVVKDLFDIEGAPTTGCCAAYDGRVATSDSAVVERLTEAGAVIVAKTNQHELACGLTNLVSSRGPVLNPQNRNHMTGGSSGGSAAAVASGAVPLAIGSDTGGSIRVPSSFCGVTGLKPTYGSISLRGAMPMSPSCDTAGPIARTAAECLAVFEVLEGFDPDDPWSVDGVVLGSPQEIKGLRIALPQTFFVNVEPETETAVRELAGKLEELGVVIDEITGPALIPRWTWAQLLFAEVANEYRDLWDEPRISPELRELIELGRNVSGPDYATAVAETKRLKRDFEWALTSADALLTPVTPYPAPRLDQETVSIPGAELDVLGGGPGRFTGPANAAGLPALAFPCGLSSDGLPLGAQLIGRRHSEKVLCKIGDRYQHTAI